ncbi:uncharacterized protein LOC126817974 [Patella vulgata]|uniref:uncharacterized protein LOC126817974 n=1 Tax=Patella vulgata TaxID=6465 RepID=UPI0021803B26|nr:uncharacterized protein LOC126817974 [Patella vulgata]
MCEKVENKADCKYNNIKIYQGNVLLDTLCGGIETPYLINTTSYNVKVIFSSDTENRFKGFRAFYTTQSSVCENTGFYGPDCEKVCHCYQSQCDIETGLCDYGCEQGWMGSRCDQVKAPAKVALFCINSTNEGQYALLRVDRGHVKYHGIYFLDGNGDRSSSNCDKGLFSENAEGILSLKMLIGNGTANPNCSHTKTGEGVFKWKIRTEEVPGFNSYYDRLYDLSCDFTTAETLIRNSKHIIKGTYQKSRVAVTQTTEDVQLVIQNPVTLTRLIQAPVGSRIKLAMILHKHDGVTALGISPFNCSCSTPDGNVSHPLTDSNGCPVQYSPVSALTGRNISYVTSNIFDAFTIKEDKNVVFSCNFEFCFESNETKCADRCGFMMGQSSLRTKRSINEKRESGQASAYLLLIPKTQNDKQTGKKNFSENSGGKHLTAITIYFLVLIVCGVLIVVAKLVRSFHIKLCGTLTDVGTEK